MGLQIIKSEGERIAIDPQEVVSVMEGTVGDEQVVVLFMRGGLQFTVADPGRELLERIERLVNWGT
jgi:hypothetical protein